MKKFKQVTTYTNRILIERSEEKDIFYLPCYLRLKIKNIESIELGEMQASITADLLLAVYYGNLADDIVQQLRDNMVLQFNRNESIQLTKSIQITVTENPNQKVFNYTIRKLFNAKIQGNLFYSPFQTINLVLVVTLRSLNVKRTIDNREDILRFNFMNNSNKWTTISHTNDKAFENYVISNALTRVSYRNTLQDDPNPSSNVHENDLIGIDSEVGTTGSEQSSENEDCHHEKIKYFQYAHFYIGMYRYPFVSLSTIFFPMWSMATFNLFIYFQGTELCYRIANLTSVNLALFAFIPTIRSQLPQTPKLLMTQLLVYLIAVTFTLTLIQSYIGKDTIKADFIWQQDPFFIFSLIASIFTVIFLIVLSIYHKVKWEPSYQGEASVQTTYQKFNRLQWSNSECDFYFKKFKCIKNYK